MYLFVFECIWYFLSTLGLSTSTSNILNSKYMYFDPNQQSTHTFYTIIQYNMYCHKTFYTNSTILQLSMWTFNNLIIIIYLYSPPNTTYLKVCVCVHTSGPSWATLGPHAALTLLGKGRKCSLCYLIFRHSFCGQNILSYLTMFDTLNHSTFHSLTTIYYSLIIHTYTFPLHQHHYKYLSSLWLHDQYVAEKLYFKAFTNFSIYPEQK